MAIKVIERGSSRLVKIETKILKKLKGVDHVVQLLKVIKSEETLLGFELLDGISEEEVLDRITVRRLRRLLRAVLTALHEAHSRGIVHRDVKLGNIVVSSDLPESRIAAVSAAGDAARLRRLRYEVRRVGCGCCDSVHSERREDSVESENEH